MVFNEADFPFKNGFLNAKQSKQVVTNMSFPDNNTELQHLQPPSGNSFGNNSDLGSKDLASSSGSSSSECRISQDHENSSGSFSTECSSTSESSNDRTYKSITANDQLEVDLDIPQDNPGGNSLTQKNFVAPNICEPKHPMTTRSRSGIHKKKTPYVGTIVSSAADSTLEPNSVEEALRLPHWKEAMENELATISKNNTWSLVPYCDSQKIVDCRWVFKQTRLMGKLKDLRPD